MKNNSIITSKYEGWIASIFLHGLLSLIFLLVIFDNPIDISEYTDVTFSNFSPIDLPVIEKNVLSPLPPTPVVASAPIPAVSSTPRSSQSVAKSITPTRRVDLPTRRMTEYDVNRIPLESQGQLTKSGHEDRINTKRGIIRGVNDNLSSLDDKMYNAVKPGNKPSDKSVGKNIDKRTVPGPKEDYTAEFEKPYEIEGWVGVDRGDPLNFKPIDYPKDVINVEGKVRLEITVLSDGTVGYLTIIKKLDATLEATVLKAMKSWKFRKLRPSEPQVNQTATITYNFKVK